MYLFVPNNLFLWLFRVSLTLAEILPCNRVTETSYIKQDKLIF